MLASAALAGASPPPGAAGHARAAAERSFVPGEVLVRLRGERERSYPIPLSTDPRALARRIERSDEVVYAAPNHIARTAGRMIPNDPGSAGEPGGWTVDQWNFLGGPGGIAVPPAWSALRRAGIPGGERPRHRQVPIVAVLDTGVAYRRANGFAPSPDFIRRQFVPGRDFVDSGTLPLDENGHGTHIAGTIAEQVDNEVALTGIAYGVLLMPVRVLDKDGNGQADDIRDGIRWAVRRGAHVINLSLEFDATVTGCGQVPGVCAAIERARSRRVLVVAAAGNGGLDEIGDGQVALPAQAALAVGATTVRGCLSRYSNWGSGLDLVAPGGGRDAVLPHPQCDPLAPDNPEIRQLSFEGDGFTEFEIVDRHGSSMAAAHVSAVAALVLATRRLHRRGHPPRVARLEGHLTSTVRPLGDPTYYGAGLVNARRAVSPKSPK